LTQLAQVVAQDVLVGCVAALLGSGQQFLEPRDALLNVCHHFSSPVVSSLTTI
jgi:hypothetical protein